MKRFSAPNELIERLDSTEFNFKAKLPLSKTFIPHNGQVAFDASVSFKVNFKCTDGQYKYAFTEFMHSYIRGSGTHHIVKPVEKMEMVPVGHIQNEINREVVTMIYNLKETIKTE